MPPASGQAWVREVTIRMSFNISSLSDRSSTIHESRNASHMNTSPASLRPSLLLRAGIVFAVLGLAASPARLGAQCTLASSPVSFEPNPPGAARLGSLSSGFSTSLALYKNASGAQRLLMIEAWGYSTLDLSNPGSPAALKYDDLRLDPAGST